MQYMTACTVDGNMIVACTLIVIVLCKFACLICRIACACVFRHTMFTNSEARLYDIIDLRVCSLKGFVRFLMNIFGNFVRAWEQSYEKYETSGVAKRNQFRRRQILRAINFLFFTKPLHPNVEVIIRVIF